MSRAWGRAAASLGESIDKMNEISQREKLEKQREANMERLRNENRQYAEQQRAEQRAYDDKRRAEERAYQTEQKALDREYQAETKTQDRQYSEAILDKRLAHQEKMTDKTISNSNEQKRIEHERRIELAAKGGGSGATNSKIQLIEYYKTVHDKDGNRVYDDKQAVQMANQLSSKSPQAVYQQLLSDLVKSGLYETEEAQTKANELTNSVFNFSPSQGGLAQPTIGGQPTVDPNSHLRRPGESISEWMQRRKQGGN